jgi:hypothetical protein
MEVVGLGVDAERAAGGGVSRRPAAPAVITCPGGGAADVHVSLVADGGQGPIPTVVGVEGLAPEQTGERVAAVEVVDRSDAAPESVGPKRTALEQGSSNRRAKKPRVRSKM